MHYSWDDSLDIFEYLFEVLFHLLFEVLFEVPFEVLFAALFEVHFELLKYLPQSKFVTPSIDSDDLPKPAVAEQS